VKAATGVMISQLSQVDVMRLTADPSPEIRAETAAKVAVQFDQRQFGTAEQPIAEDIFRALVKDAEVKVREALAQNLKTSPDLPEDVALALAKDVESVALPILQFSEVLSDRHLVEIVGQSSAAKQEAIAQRPRVSVQVADALIDTGNEVAVSKLLVNEGAELTERSLQRVAVKYEGSQPVSKAMVQRPDLPPAVAEQVMSEVTEYLQNYLVNEQRLPADMVGSLIKQARDRVTAGLYSSNGKSDAEVAQMVDQLAAGGRLSASMALQALSNGDMTFFEMAMARLAGIPHENAQTLIHDDRSNGLRSILKAANC